MSLLPFSSHELEELLKPDSTHAGFLWPGLSGDELMDDFQVPSSPVGILESLPPVVALPGTTTAAFDSNESSENNQDTPPAVSAAADAPPCGPAGSARGDAVDPKERVRAKNRRAQARYREKLKNQRKETEESYERAQADLERLRLENAALSQRKDVMERILTIREEAQGRLEQSQETLERTEKSGWSLMMEKMLPYAPSLQRRQTTSDEKEDESAAAAAICTRAVGTNPALDSACRSLQHLSPLELRALKLMSFETVQAKYGELTEKLRTSLCLSQDASAPAAVRGAAEKEWQDVLWQCGCVCFEQAVANPTNLQLLLTASVGEGDESTPGGLSWAELTRALNITPSQRASLQHMREAFIARAQRVEASRRQILRSLPVPVPPAASVAAAAGDRAAGALDGLRALQGATSGWLAAHAATAELDANLHEEHIVCVEFLARVMGGVLTPMQKAKAITLAAPAFPDVFAIATAAVEEGAQQLEGGGAAATQLGG